MWSGTSSDQADQIEAPPRAGEKPRPAAAPAPSIRPPRAAPDTIAEFRSAAALPLNRHAASILRSVVLEAVFPELAGRHGLTQTWSEPLRVSKRMPELVELLIATDLTAALGLINELQADEPSTLPLFRSVFEPAARRLGDLWSEDGCSEVDVTLALARIQAAVRLSSRDMARRRIGRQPGPEVLIAPEPGEPHGLGAALDSEVLWDIGWNPHCEYPADDHALEDILAATWFDVLDLSLSAAFRREHWLPRLKKTIAAARHASCNPTLVVIVGGRVFAEHLAIGAQVGADMASTTALHVDQSIMDGLNRVS